VKLTTAEIENECSYTSTPLYAFVSCRGTVSCVSVVYPAVGGWADGAVSVSVSYSNMAAVRNRQLSCEWQQLILSVVSVSEQSQS